MDTRGLHLLIELHGCDRALLDDAARLAQIADVAARAVGATPVSEAFHRFAPQGVTGVLLLAESHLSIHTWPESGYAAVDLFTCGGLDPRSATPLFADALRAERWETRLLERGRPSSPGVVEIERKP